MLSLFKPFRHSAKPGALKRIDKTPGALYRLLSDDFERTKACGCSCKMPMIFESQLGAGDEPNWRVESLWCGRRECHEAMAEVVERNQILFNMKKLPVADMDVTTAFARAA